ncbi:MAG TPA: threonine/serine exporter [Ruminococcaceae bacterium]|nr:threonine/serine exporter [Oscillospiraceae bacterium]
MQQDRLLKNALDLGEQMLICGAEISRVEDTISRIANAYGSKRTDVFVITSVIFLTLTDDNEKTVTGTRRVKKYSTNLDKLHKYNDLSRRLCAQTPEDNSFETGIEKIKAEKPYNLPVQCIFSAVVAAAFAVFFGGSIKDALSASVIGLIVRLITFAQSKTKVNTAFSNVVSSAILSALAFLAVKTGLGDEASKIIIGNIMLLIPGVALTNSIRDIISGDIVSGILRFIEAMVTALAIAAGYVIAALLMGGGSL